MKEVQIAGGARNPYASPNAPVSEASLDGERGTRPRGVSIAIRLLWASLGADRISPVLGILELGLDFIALYLLFISSARHWFRRAEA